MDRIITDKMGFYKSHIKVKFNPWHNIEEDRIKSFKEIASHKIPPHSK
jgi:hypothetical protein